MAEPQVIIEWIKKAQEDFEFARINLEEEKPFFHKFVSISTKLLRNI